MNLSKSLLFFGIPGSAIALLFTFVYPSLISLNIPISWATYICSWSPLLMLLSFVMLKFKTSKLDFSHYFWIKKLNLKQIGLVLVAFLVVQVGETLLSFTRPILASLPGFTVPSYYPDLFQADMALEIPLKTLLGINLQGNIYAILFFALWLATNIGCEEILWRGYALPRMERHFGKWAWLVNGLLWNIAIHFFFRWSFITLLPISLIVPYLSQKYKSLWPGVIIHGLGNMLIFVIVIPSVLS